MSSVLGVSVGAGAIRVAIPHPGNSAERFVSTAFDVQAMPVAEQQSMDDVAAETVGAVFGSAPEIAATALAYRNEQHARTLRGALARRQLTNYELVPEVAAAREFLRATGELQGYRTVALYDLGSSGLSVSVIDVESGKVSHSERTSDISGDYLDSLIREQQIASGRIEHPPTAQGLAALDGVCRQAKEQLSSTTAVAVPSEHGLVLLSQENFEALIMLAVESSARMTRDVMMRSEQAVQAVFVIGGCARIPLIARILERWMGMPVLVPADPETVIVRGAALLARPAQVAAPAPVPQAPGPGSADDTVQLAPVWLSEDALRRARKRNKARGKSAPGGKVGAVDAGRRRELSVAGVAVGALVVVAALGIGLGWGQSVLRGDSQSNTSAPSSVPDAPPRASADPSVAPTTDATNASVAAPTPNWQAPTTTTSAAPPGPPTIVVPGLPPIVVPTIPPLLPPFPPRQ
ncbi:MULTISPECIES: Hsp70 family protein [Nocardia]|uniref:Hsp70 family protein n=1 Tax=Nocardia TaxID=1817 RepID=UPI0007EC0270|nr:MULTISPECIES: Hsp70 family protein [Nocardia]OBF69168.1 molecular chaperone [Mycobacterium sp. 852002-51759_SCH5129042]MBF6272616.1 Hsp70 family protein [Nocardia nova]OBA48221.1 molecular chaperone [Nocardia sp. 852002-51101_SCH5132738]OBB30561.1 molecular chaperone [Nocardia sp. 852002-51244_SCH5132740]PPI98584.1 molecular chaperone [Nocardia nova]